jgi:hypothetical protein
MDKQNYSVRLMQYETEKSKAQREAKSASE